MRYHPSTAMRHSLYATAALAALLLSSCSDDPVTPGIPQATEYSASLEFYNYRLRSLWGDESGVCVSGSSIMRFDGEQWSAMILPESDAGDWRTWGTSTGDMFALGSSRLNKFDGTAWHGIPRPASVRDVWGAPNGEVFVVGYRRLYHYDGTDWSVDSLIVPSPVWDPGLDDPFRYIAGDSPDDVYVFGSVGWFGHFDGSDWSATRPDTTREFNRGWKAPDGPLYALNYGRLFTYDGTSLTPVDLGTAGYVSAIAGRSADEVYCAIDEYASNNSILRYDGASWSKIAEIPGNVESIWGDQSTNRLFASGYDVLWEVNGSTPKQSLGTRGDDNTFYDVWGSDEGAIYAIGTHAYRYVDGNWEDLKKQELTLSAAYSIWGRSENEIYAVGPGMILHYDGAKWVQVSGGAQHYLHAVSGNAEEVFAVGYRGVILRYDGQSWKQMESGTSYELFAVHAWEGGAFAGGESGALMRYDGKDWRPANSPVSWAILDFFGFDSDRIIAVGSNGSEVCYWDGNTWKPEFIGYLLGANYSVWGTSERNIFISKGNGDVVHFDGQLWSALPRLTGQELTGIWGDDNGQIFAAGYGGVIRYSR